MQPLPLFILFEQEGFNYIGATLDSALRRLIRFVLWILLRCFPKSLPLNQQYEEGLQRVGVFIRRM